MAAAPDYLNPQIPPNLKQHRIPVIDATAESIRGFGQLVDDPEGFDIEIVRWPAQGWRPVDSDSGYEGGTTQGTFISQWEGDVLCGRNDAVSGDYILGYAKDPSVAIRSHQQPPERILLWHANYHPDGGQLFFPLDAKPFVVPLAMPSDDVSPDDFVCFRFDGSQGLYIHPNIWHEGVFVTQGMQRFFDKQGAVHARVSVDFANEFNCLLEVPLR